MNLFKRKKEEGKIRRNELCDIPIGSMVELTDLTTFALEEEVAPTFELIEYKKYEADRFLRYMYHLVSNDDEVILGVDYDASLNEYNVARFVIDSEEEFTEPLGDTIVMEFEDPENEGETVPVRYGRNNVVNTKMTIVTSDGTEEYEDVEIQDYSAEDGSILMVELWDSIFTFFLGESMERSSVNVFPVDRKKD